jgi:hypothetical protein
LIGQPLIHWYLNLYDTIAITGREYQFRNRRAGSPVLSTQAGWELQ